ncbi:hypothetical protein Val02_60460 [Virgisporangium aliadipatigenens]|uniref:Uncharacterized protein n=1 Tax=Virgisporangium aliadipatigenens TaxID=741659 RepID=A0A8J3YSP0_9ACTN|nr:hypothetical protein [Virgisporangium aliadipatigenens]GIJ49160.1 hypothetical protein Val02_60460 [Virgisporangium aliadipatigenens]
MLAVSSYARDYIEGRRARFDEDVAAFRAAGVDDAAFEAVYFNNLVLALELSFVHRLRALEKQDGNALNEVRLLAHSLLHHGGRLVEDRQITLDPAKTVLGYAVGDEIAVREADFVRLCKAFFAEIEARYIPAE